MCFATAQLTWLGRVPSRSPSAQILGQRHALSRGGIPMSKYTRHLGASLMLVGAILLGACGGGEKKSDSTALGADTTLNRDLALAGKDTTAQPQLKDVPTTAPSANAPASSTPTSRAPARTQPRTQPRTTTPKTQPAPETH